MIDRLFKNVSKYFKLSLSNSGSSYNKIVKWLENKRKLFI